MLSACPAILPAGITLSGIDAGWGLAEKITATNADVIKVVCQRWAVIKAQSRATAVDPWLDQACNTAAPPPLDPAAAVIWLGGLIVEHNRLSSTGE